MSHGMSKAVNTKLTPKVSNNCMMLTISICFQVRLCSPATAFATKRNRWASSVFDGKAAEGKNRRYESKEDAPTVVFRPRTSPLGAVCLNSRTTWGALD